MILFDVKTTGLDDSKDKIVQIAMMKSSNNTIIETFNALVNPEIPRREQLEAAKIHGLTPEMLEEEKPFEFYAKTILKSIKINKIFLPVSVAAS